MVDGGVCVFPLRGAGVLSSCAGASAKNVKRAPMVEEPGTRHSLAGPEILPGK